MCGIAGLAGRTGPGDEAVVARMCVAIEHRGPDDRGLHVEPGAMLGVQRLAIVDVAGGNQPIYNESGDVAVVLNGEIYNHELLRHDLEARGHRFRTRADTEVLVHLYEEHGAALAGRLRGMFAFAIWDQRRRRLLLGRDRVGKKPLFWHLREGRLSFASELVALLQDEEVPREVDPRALDAYLLLGYVPHPLSILRGVQKLPPATTLVYDEGGSPRIEQYWRLRFDEPRRKGDIREWAEELRRLLQESTEMRLMSDVPLGAFLSGGVDSGAVVGAMARAMTEPVRTFSIGFRDPAFDESAHARRVAEHYSTDHTELVVEPEALAILPRMARHYGEPFADSSAIPTFYLAELTSRDVTVALNGDGGDEAFGGYGRYERGLRLGRLDWLPRRVQHALGKLASPLRPPGDGASFTARAIRLSRQAAQPDWHRFLNSLAAFPAERRDRLRAEALSGQLAGWRAENLFMEAWAGVEAETVLARMQGTDMATYLPGDLLPKVDIASMAHSLEARSPFLDHEMLEFAASLPDEAKLSGGERKRVLKHALRGDLPDEILDRPKMGFGVPISRWFREELRHVPSDLLVEGHIVAGDWVDRAEVIRLVRAHGSGAADQGLQLWVLVQLEMWAREVLQAPVVRASL
jgi:asparagine synthase (glutamine-hydrolysing)